MILDLEVIEVKLHCELAHDFAQLESLVITAISKLGVIFILGFTTLGNCELAEEGSPLTSIKECYE